MTQRGGGLQGGLRRSSGWVFIVPLHTRGCRGSPRPAAPGVPAFGGGHERSFQLSRTPPPPTPHPFPFLAVPPVIASKQEGCVSKAFPLSSWAAPAEPRGRVQVSHPQTDSRTSPFALGVSVNKPGHSWKLTLMPGANTTARLPH